MKALTIRQPWAQLIAIGAKTIETRSRPTHHRGTLAIHAGVSQRAIGIDFWQAHGPKSHPIYTALSEAGLGAAPHDELPLGAIVAVADVIDCVSMHSILSRRDIPAAEPVHPAHDEQRLELHQVYGHDAYLCDGKNGRDVTDQLPFGDFAPGRWAWLLADVRRLPEPIPCRGAQGLWNVPADVEAQITGRAA